MKRYYPNASPFSGKHDEANIASGLDKLMMERDIPVDIYPVYIIMDSARNMKSVIRALS